MKLKVNEMFGPTLQGEGATAGKEVVFLRLSGCNLHCIWCDTPYTWNWQGSAFAHPDKYDRSKEEKELDLDEICAKLCEIGNSVKALVVSGGEPLMQQKQLTPLLSRLKNEGWWIELETNGTLTPNEDLLKVLDQINCSPKLSNSGNSASFRIRERAMKALASIPFCYFKFVVSSALDVEEIHKYIEDFNLDRSRIFLMPLGKTNDELSQTREYTQALATLLGLTFSDRLHVTMFGGVRGV